MFKSFTYPKIAALFADLPSSMIAIGGSIDGKPIGLALGLVAGDGSAELASIFVAKSHRRAEIGSQLVATLMRHLKEAGARHAMTRIGGRNEIKPIFERLLKRLGWSSLACESIRVIGLAGAMASEGGKWTAVQHLLGEPGSIEYDHWAQVSAQDWLDIDALVPAAIFGRPPSEFLRSDELEAHVCVLIRHTSRPIGWIVGKRTGSPLPEGNAPAVFYTSAYIAPPFARQGILVAGFWHAFTRQAERYGPDSIAFYQTNVPRMMAMSRRRFVPIALRSDEVFRSTVRLDL